MKKQATVDMDSECLTKDVVNGLVSDVNGLGETGQFGTTNTSDTTIKSATHKTNGVAGEDDGIHHPQNGHAMLAPLSPFPSGGEYGLNPFSSSSFATRTLSSLQSPASQLHSLQSNNLFDSSGKLVNGLEESLGYTAAAKMAPATATPSLMTHPNNEEGVKSAADSGMLAEGVHPNPDEDVLNGTMGMIHSSSFSALASSSAPAFSNSELESTSTAFLFNPAAMVGDSVEEARRKSLISIVTSPLASARTVPPPGFHTLEETIGVVMTSPSRRASLQLHHQHIPHHTVNHFAHRISQNSTALSEQIESASNTHSGPFNEESDDEKSCSPKRKSRRLSISQARNGSISVLTPITSAVTVTDTAAPMVPSVASDEMHVSDAGDDSSDSDYDPTAEAEVDDDGADEEVDEEEDEEEMRHDQFGVMSWICSQRERGKSPASTLSSLLSFFPPDLGKREAKNSLWNAAMSVGVHLSKALAKQERRRKKLLAINSMDDAVALIRHSSRIVVLTGAGVSVSAGIPDFRSKGGIYVRLKEEFGCESPEDMFDMEVFKNNPKMFYSFAHEVYPASYNATLTHKFVALLEEKGKLLRNYTQNIDNLEEKAKINRVLQCHGSFATASCITCKYKIKGLEIEKQIMAKEIAYCPKCHSPEALQARATNASQSGESNDLSYGVMKPDIIFFSEPLPSTFHQALEEDRGVADLVIVVGSSLKVHPVAGMLATFPSTVPMILINREVVGFPDHFDIELLGDCDIISAELAKRLQWQVCHHTFDEYAQQEIPFKFFPPNRYVFPRASQSLEEVHTQIVDSSFYASLYRPAMSRPEKDFFSELNHERKRKRMEEERRKNRPLRHGASNISAGIAEESVEEEAQNAGNVHTVEREGVQDMGDESMEKDVAHNSTKQGGEGNDSGFEETGTESNISISESMAGAENTHLKSCTTTQFHSNGEHASLNGDAHSEAM